MFLKVNENEFINFDKVALIIVPIIKDGVLIYPSGFTPSDLSFVSREQPIVILFASFENSDYIYYFGKDAEIILAYMDQWR